MAVMEFDLGRLARGLVDDFSFGEEDIRVDFFVGLRALLPPLLLFEVVVIPVGGRYPPGPVISELTCPKHSKIKSQSIGSNPSVKSS